MNKHGIKQIPAGAEYKASAERVQRDTLKSFMQKSEFVDQSFDKLFKVLTPGDVKDGYPKTDVFEFIAFLQKACSLH